MPGVQSAGRMQQATIRSGKNSSFYFYWELITIAEYDKQHKNSNYATIYTSKTTFSAPQRCASQQRNFIC